MLFADRALQLGLTFSPTKTTTITFSAIKPKQTLYLSGSPIATPPTVRYLGIFIDRRLSFKHRIQGRVEFKVGPTCLKSLEVLLREPRPKYYSDFTQSLIDYSAPIIPLACNEAVQTLLVSQRSALEVALGIPKWTVTELTYAEAHTLPAHHRAEQVLTKYLTKAGLSSKPPLFLEKIKTSRSHDPHIVSDKNWNGKAACLLNAFQIPIISPDPNPSWPPWLSLPTVADIDSSVIKHKDPEATQHIALQNINKYAATHCAYVY